MSIRVSNESNPISSITYESSSITCPNGDAHQTSQPPTHEQIYHELYNGPIKIENLIIHAHAIFSSSTSSN